MKEINNFKTYKTKVLSENIANTKKQILSSQEYLLLSEFRTLTPHQRLYVLETLKNIKKHKL